MDSSLLSTHHSGRWILLKNEVINSSIPQEVFPFDRKSFPSCIGEKVLELRWDKNNGYTKLSYNW